MSLEILHIGHQVSHYLFSTGNLQSLVKKLSHGFNWHCHADCFFSSSAVFLPKHTQICVWYSRQRHIVTLTVVTIMLSGLFSMLYVNAFSIAFAL